MARLRQCCACVLNWRHRFFNAESGYCLATERKENEMSTVSYLALLDKLLPLSMMIQVESWFIEHKSFRRGEECAGLANIVEVKNGSPAPVKCTRKVYYSIVKHIDAVSQIKIVHTKFKI